MKRCKAIVFLVLLLVLGLLLAGCGDSSSSDGGGGDSEKSSSSKSSKKQGTVKDFVMAQYYDGTYYGFSKSGKVVKQSTGDALKDAGITNDGTLYVFLTEGEELWTFDGSQFTKIDEEVREFDLAPFGGGIAYVNYDDTLFLYNGKTQKVQEEISDYCCISPDGKAVAYTIKDEDDNTSKAYLYNGKVQELGKGITPRALSDGGKYVYLRRETDNGSAYYVQKGADSDSRQKLGDSFQYCIYNTSGTQVVYYDGNKTYFCENGGERQSISSNALSILLPGYSYISNSYAVSSLKNQYYRYNGDNGANICLLTNKLELETRMKNVSSVSLQTDGKTLIYMKNENLYSADISKESPEAVKLLDSPVNFKVSTDGKMLFYVDEERVTHTMKIGSKAEKVSEDSIYDVAVCGSGFLYVLDGDCFFTTGGKGTKVTGLRDDVNYVGGTPLYSLIYTEEGSLFITINGEKVQLIYGE